MAATTVYLRGKCDWAKPTKVDPKYNNYTVDLYPDEASLQAFKMTDAQTKVTDTDKGKMIKLRRPHSKMVKDEVRIFGPVEVLDNKNQPFIGLIGNGSEVTCKVVVYDTVKGKGTRLEAMRVETLVPYEANNVVGTVDSPF